MDTFHKALEARLCLAKSKILADKDEAENEELQAYEHAYDLGRAAFHTGERASALISSESLLLKVWEDAKSDAELDADREERSPTPCWLGEWHIDMDGVCEARGLVASKTDHFLAGLEVSRLGGDCEPSWSDTPYPTFEAAQQASETRVDDWLAADPDSDASATAAMVPADAPRPARKRSASPSM